MSNTTDQHLANIRAKLNPDEAAWFDGAITKLSADRPEALSRIAALPVDVAVAQLRFERGVSGAGLMTRQPGCRCDDPDSLTDTPGHELEE